MRDPEAVVGWDYLNRPELVGTMEQHGFVERMKLAPAEIGELLGQNPVWGAFALAIGFSIEMFNWHGYSKRKAGRLPDNFDMMQLTYLPLATDFVTNDDGLLEVAPVVAEYLRRTRGAAAEVRTAKQFFRRTGYDHPELEKRR